MRSSSLIRRTYFRSVVILIAILLTIICIIEPVQKVSFRGNADISNFPNAVANYFGTSIKSKEVLPELPIGQARHDNQRILRIHDFYFTGSLWETLVDKYDVCFATQATIERIYWVPYILEKWSGPLSLAIQLTSDEDWLIFNLYLNYLTKCHSTFANQVAIHLAVPANLTALKIDDKLLDQWKGVSWEAISKKSETCPDAKEYLKYLLDMLPTTDPEKLKYKEVYPQNHMRNIGRKGCPTHWTYSADIDIIPSDRMADMLQAFYDDQKMQGKLCEKCAYVIPTFEMNETFPFPENKKKVTELFNTEALQPFHFKYYSPGHAATDYKKWITNKIDDQNVTISHEINQKLLTDYEPFYVSSDLITPFDERFLGYGFTRNSQFKEAFTTKWTFSVLTPVFSIHWGLQTRDTLFSPKKDGTGRAVRKEQTGKNYLVFKKLVQELECKKSAGLI